MTETKWNTEILISFIKTISVYVVHTCTCKVESNALNALSKVRWN